MRTERTEPLRDRAGKPASAGTPRGRRPGGFARAVGILGRVLVAAGLILLFYTTYLLWGTGVYTKQQQRDLAAEVAAKPLVTEQAFVPGGDVPPARPAAAPKLGDPLFTLAIEKIGLRQVVVQGVGREELKKGPGHFEDAPYPGEAGNVAISGHRTTYGAPFFRLNELQAGDVIDIESGPARYRYRVREQKIVSPEAVEVVDNHGRDELTLTTCHPRFSAAQRLIVHADYVGASLIPKAPPPRAVPGEEKVEEPETTLVPGTAPAIPMDAIVLAGIALAALLGAMALSDRLRAPAVWASVAIGSAAGLWVFVFPQVLRMMPANY